MTLAKKFVQTLIAAAALSHTWAFSQTVIKFAHYGPTSDPVHVGALKFKEVLEKESAGAFKVEIFPQEQLGKGADMIIGTQVGSIDVSVTGNPFYGGVSPEQAALDIPFLFRTVDHAYRVIDGPLGRELMDKFDARGLKGLLLWRQRFEFGQVHDHRSSGKSMAGDTHVFLHFLKLQFGDVDSWIFLSIHSLGVQRQIHFRDGHGCWVGTPNFEGLNVHGVGGGAKLHAF